MITKRTPAPTRRRSTGGLTGYVGILGQIGVTGPEAANTMLGSLNRFADLFGGFDGLEGVGMSAFLSSALVGDFTPAMQQYQWLVSGLGMPDIGGGGFATCPVLHAGTGAFGLPSITDVQQRVQDSASGPTGAFLHAVESMAVNGISAVGTGLGLESATAKQVGNTVVETVAGVAIGVAAGSVFGPVGWVIGGIAGGIAGFFDSIFGSHDGNQHTAAQGVASGDRAVVQAQMPVEKGGRPQVVGADGSTGPAPPGAGSGPAPAPPNKSCVTPAVHKCQVDDGVVPDFAVPYWAQPVLIGAAIPVGPGLDAMSTVVPLAGGLTGIQLAELPTVNEVGVLQSGGLALAAVELQLHQLERLRLPAVVGSDAWSGLSAQLLTAQPRHPSALAPDLLVNRLRLEGFTPEESIASVLRTLHRRYGD